MRYIKSPYGYAFIFLLLFFASDYLVHKLIQTGLEKYYGIDTDYEIAFVGHSHLMLGIDKELFENQFDKKVSKYTIEGVNVYDRHQMLNHLLDENENLEVVVYGVDAWMFTGSGLSENSYRLFLPFMNNEMIESYIRDQVDYSEYLQKKFIKSSRYNERLVSGSMRGYLGVWSNLKFGTLDVEEYRRRIENGDYRPIDSSSVNRERFEQSVNMLTSSGIKVLLLYVPTSGLYNNRQPQEFDEELTYFRNLEEENDNVHYFEYIEGWENNYELFFDPIHLNPEGQRLLTETFLNDVEQIRSKLDL